MTDKGASIGGSTTREKIRGTFDLFLLFGRGIKPFEKEGTFRHAMLSIWFMVLSTPLSFVSAYLYQPQGMEEAPYSAVVNVIAGQTLIGTVLGLAIGYLFAVVMGRKDRFWLWFQVGNWMTIPNLVIGIPVIAVAATGYYPRADMDNIMTLLTYYNVVVGGCITFRALKIGWEMAGFFACMSVFVSQQIWNVMFWMNGYTAP